jgi:hypothetical protein
VGEDEGKSVKGGLKKRREKVGLEDADNRAARQALSFAMHFHDM